MERRNRREILGMLGAGLLTVSQPGAASGADFRVDITSAPDEVVAGEDASISVEVRNIGSAEDTQTINLEGRFAGGEAITLGPDESGTVSVTYSPPPGTRGEEFVTVESEDDSDTVGIDVLKPAELHPNVIDTNSPVVAGMDNFEIEVEVENVGDVSGSATMEYEVGLPGRVDEYEGEQGVSAGGGETSEETVSFETEHKYSDMKVLARARIEDRSSTTEGRIISPRPAEFEIEAIEADAVPEGEDLEVVVAVRNVKHQTEEKPVTCTVNNDSMTEHVELERDEKQEVTFTFETEHGDDGQYTASVETPSDEGTEQVEILQQATFRPTIEELGTNVPADENLVVTATVENVGDVDGEDTVALHLERDESGELTLVDETSVSLESGGEETVELVAEGPQELTGSVRLELRSSRETETEFVDVVTGPVTEIDDVDVADSVGAGTDLPVEVSLTNTSDVERESEVTAEIAELDAAVSETVDVAGGETETASLSLGIPGGETGEETLVIFVVEQGGADSENEDEAADEASTTVERTLEITEEAGTSQGGEAGGGETDAEGPGFGVGAGIAGVTAAGYLLKQKLNEDEKS